MRSEGPGLPDPYFQAHAAPAPTNTRPPAEQSFRLLGPRAPTFGVFDDLTLDERRTEVIGSKALPMRFSVATVSPMVAAGLQNAVARISNFPNRLLLGLKLYKSDGGATSATDPMNFQPGYDTMANLPRRTFPWTRSPRVTRWPIAPVAYPDFMGGWQ